MNAFGATLCVICSTTGTGMTAIPGPQAGPTIHHHSAEQGEQCTQLVLDSGITGAEYLERITVLMDDLAKRNPRFTRAEVEDHYLGYGSQNGMERTLFVLSTVTSATLLARQPTRA